MWHIIACIRVKWFGNGFVVHFIVSYDVLEVNAGAQEEPGEIIIICHCIVI